MSDPSDELLDRVFRRMIEAPSIADKVAWEEILRLARKGADAEAREREER